VGIRPWPIGQTRDIAVPKLPNICVLHDIQIQVFPAILHLLVVFLASCVPRRAEHQLVPVWAAGWKRIVETTGGEPLDTPLCFGLGCVEDGIDLHCCVVRVGRTNTDVQSVLVLVLVPRYGQEAVVKLLIIDDAKAIVVGKPNRTALAVDEGASMEPSLDMVGYWQNIWIRSTSLCDSGVCSFSTSK